MPTIPYKSRTGERLTGVTTIISAHLGWNKGALMHWAWKQGMDGKNYRDSTAKDADAGTIAHHLIECDLTGAAPELAAYPEELIATARTSFGNYLNWKKIVKFKPLEVEPHLVSEQFRYGMTPDCIAKINRKTSLFDWKTSSGLYPEMLLQLAAYEHGWNENHPDNPITGGAYLLRIDKASASFHFHHWADLTTAWQAFVCLLELNKLQAVIKRMA